jgi:hypothetical protein
MSHGVLPCEDASSLKPMPCPGLDAGNEPPTLARSVAHLGAFNRPVPATAAIAKSNRWFSGKFRLLLTDAYIEKKLTE